LRSFLDELSHDAGAVPSLEVQFSVKKWTDHPKKSTRWLKIEKRPIKTRHHSR
jgi:hypothetical protein